MLKGMSMPVKFWGKAFMCAIYVLNRAPTKSLNSISFLLTSPCRHTKWGHGDVKEIKTLVSSVLFIFFLLLPFFSL